MTLRSAIAAIAALFVTAAAWAHPPTQAVAYVAVAPGGGVDATIAFDPVALLLGKPSDEVTDTEIDGLLARGPQTIDSSLRALQLALLSSIALRADDTRLVAACTAFPSADDLLDWRTRHREKPTAATMAMRLHAQLPPTARTIGIQLPDALGASLFALDRPGLERAVLPLDAGLESPGMDVTMAFAAANPAGEVPPASAPAAVPGAAPAAAAPPADPGTLAVLWRYVVLGFRHIVPDGADHALFVLGLFLLSPRALPLAKQVTAFTAAHTLTLTLAVLGWVHVPAGLVEPAIAGSIAFVAVENLFTTRVGPWRLAAVFLFGLLHGLGFASGLAELGLPAGRLATGIGGFAIGVEAGHLAVIAAAFLLLGWTRSRPWYRTRVQIPCSVAIATVACWWIVTRLAAG